MLVINGLTHFNSTFVRLKVRQWLTGLAVTPAFQFNIVQLKDGTIFMNSCARCNFNSTLYD